jgi:hypothetical protein
MSVLERVRYLKVGKFSLEAPSNWAPPVWFIRKEGPILNEQTCPMSPTTREPGEGRGRSGHSYCQRIPLFLCCTRESVNTFAEWFFRRLHSSHGNTPPPNRLRHSSLLSHQLQESAMDCDHHSVKFKQFDSMVLLSCMASKEFDYFSARGHGPYHFRCNALKWT